MFPDKIGSPSALNKTDEPDPVAPRAVITRFNEELPEIKLEKVAFTPNQVSLSAETR